MKRYQINSSDDLQSIKGTLETSGSSILLIEAPLKIVDHLKSIVDECFSHKNWTIGYHILIKEVLNFTQTIFIKNHIIFEDLNELFVELEWQLEEEPSDNKPYFLDQVITVLPVIYAKIVFQYLKGTTEKSILLDSRDLFEANNNYGNGIIETENSIKRISAYKNILQNTTTTVILPADIASSTENYGVSISKGKMEIILEKHFNK